jgi:glyoxylase-like metal-dependent hydrolase (beta-lactamase superfamily II)
MQARANMQLIKWHLLEAGYCRHPEWVTMRGGRLRACEFPALVAVLEHPVHGAMLFDTGYSQHFLDATAALPEALYRWVTPVNLAANRSVAAQLTSRQVPSQTIEHIVLSHFHGDHIGGLHDFPNAKILCSMSGWTDFLTHSRIGALSLGLLRNLAPANLPARSTYFENQPVVELHADLAPLRNGYDLFADGSIVAVELAGHAKGHFGITFVDIDGHRVLLIGDAAWSSEAIERNAPPPSFVSGWLGNTEEYRATLAMLHELHCRSPHVRIVPSHCERWRSQVTAP